MEKKKRSMGFTVLLYTAIIVFTALIIWSIVSSFNTKYENISVNSASQLVKNADNSRTLLKYEEVEDTSYGTTNVKLEFKNQVTNKNEYYTFTLATDQYKDPNLGPVVALPGENQNVEYHTVAWSTFFRTTIEENFADCSVVQTYYKEPGWISWLPTIISILVTVGITIFLFKFLLASAGGGAKGAMDFSKSTARRADNSKVKFADVAGCDEEKAEMTELVDYLKDPKKFTKYGAKLPKGVLLVGPPGTGKTLLAKAVAGEAGVPFYSISGSDFVEMFVGVGAGRVRDLFKTAKQNAPCLIFIDEIDAVGRQRGAGLGGGNDEREQTLNQLLVELDGFEENSGIIVIAATNREDVLDPALLRAGRFDRQITVDLPDREGREAIFKVHAKNKKLDPTVDFKQLAKRTVGFSGADIANILNEAAILAVRSKRDTITIADVDEAIDRRIAGPAKSSKGLNANERKLVAYHEAGHAIVGLTLPNSDKVRKITIIPRGRTGGHVLMGPEDDRFLLTKNELEARIVGLLGGRSSEEIFFKDVTTGASNDIERATQIARAMVVEYGMSALGPIQYEKDTGSVFLGRDYTNAQKNFSGRVADEIDNEVRKIIEESHNKALEIITTRKDDVILIAETLLENETITEEQIDYLLEHRKLPEATNNSKNPAEPTLNVENPTVETKENVEVSEVETPITNEENKE